MDFIFTLRIKYIFLIPPHPNLKLKIKFSAMILPNSDLILRLYISLELNLIFHSWYYISPPTHTNLKSKSKSRPLRPWRS